MPAEHRQVRRGFERGRFARTTGRTSRVRRHRRRSWLRPKHHRLRHRVAGDRGSAGGDRRSPGCAKHPWCRHDDHRTRLGVRDGDGMNVRTRSRLAWSAALGSIAVTALWVILGFVWAISDQPALALTLAIVIAIAPVGATIAAKTGNP